jgi:peptide/nickel transport system substrate-binding protein
MKKALAAIAVFALGSSAAAQAFVWPARLSATPASEAKSGGTLRGSNFGSDPRTFNPFTSTSAGSILDVINGVALMRLDEATLEYVPYGAADYKISADKTIITFNIRKGIKWSDGKPFTADDIITTHKIYTDEDVGYSGYSDWFINDKPITVTKIDADTVRFNFPKAAVTNIALMTASFWPNHVFGPVYSSKGAAGIKAMWSTKEDADTFVSGNAWKFTGFRPGERMSFVKNPFYGEWNKDSAGKSLPYLDGRVISIYKDQNAQFAAYLAGQLDAFNPRQADDLAQIKRTIDAGNLKAVLRANIGPVSGRGWIAFNWNKKSDPEKQRLFRDTNFRRAMSHLLNRKAMIDNVYGGLAIPVYSEVPGTFKDWISPNINKFDFNPEQATKLLSSLGYNKKNAEGYLINRQNRVLEFTAATNTGNSTGDAMMRIWAEEAKKVGVKINYAPIAFSTLVGQLTAEGPDRPFDAIFIYFGAADPIWPFTETIEKCDGAFHVFNLSGKCITPWETQVDALNERGKQEFDTTKRKQVAYQMQNIWSANQPLVYMPAGVAHFSWTARTKGEFPAGIATAFTGSRLAVLTWIQE